MGGGEREERGEVERRREERKEVIAGERMRQRGKWKGDGKCVTDWESHRCRLGGRGEVRKDA